jgi:hypothetical protein
MAALIGESKDNFHQESMINALLREQGLASNNLRISQKQARENARKRLTAGYKLRQHTMSFLTPG